MCYTVVSGLDSGTCVQLLCSSHLSFVVVVVVLRHVVITVQYLSVVLIRFVLTARVCRFVFNLKMNKDLYISDK